MEWKRIPIFFSMCFFNLTNSRKQYLWTALKNRSEKIKSLWCFSANKVCLPFRKKEIRSFLLCCGHFLKKLNTTVKSRKEEKSQGRQTKMEMESGKNMLSFVLLACWQHLMNGRLLTANAWPLCYVATWPLVLGIVFTSSLSMNAHSHKSKADLCSIKEEG